MHVRHLDFSPAEGFSSLLSGKKISFHRPLSASELRWNLVKSILVKSILMNRPKMIKSWSSLGDSSVVYIFKNSLRNWMLTQEGPWGGVRSGSGRMLLSPQSQLVSKGREKKAKKQWNEDHRRISVARDVYDSWRKMKCMCVYLSDTAFTQHLLSLEMRRRAG